MTLAEAERWKHMGSCEASTQLELMNRFQRQQTQNFKAALLRRCRKLIRKIH